MLTKTFILLILVLIAGSAHAGAGKGGGAGNGDGSKVKAGDLMDCDWLGDTVKVKCEDEQGCLPAEYCALIPLHHDGEGTEDSPISVKPRQ